MNVPTPESPAIPKALEDQVELLKDLSGLISELIRRLEPVRKELCPVASLAVPECSCKLVHELVKNNVDLRMSIDQLNNLINSLEV